MQAASGLFPRLPSLLGSPLISNKGAMGDSPRSDAKSPFSTTSGEERPSVVTTEGGISRGGSEMPLDLSAKGSSPSVSPLSDKQDDLPLNDR